MFMFIIFTEKVICYDSSLCTMIANITNRYIYLQNNTVAWELINPDKEMCFNNQRRRDTINAALNQVTFKLR